MKRAKVHEVSSPISLFPFIGILLCTMGALLVILVAVSRSARDSAVEHVQASQRAGSSVLVTGEQQIEQVSEYVENLKVAQANGQTKLSEEQKRLSHLEDHIRRLRDQYRSLQAAALELKSLEEEHYDDRSQAERELSKLHRLAEELRQSNASLREDVAKGKRSYALVPYEGPNGTFRRPMYIECRERELVLQPEGVVITADDLRPPIGAGNVLASALRTARDHFVRLHPGEGKSRDTEPYPLLLVRPEGLFMYDRARRAIEAGDFDFGFELVESDWNLKYPAVDYNLAALEQSAIEQARVRQQVLAEAAPRAYRNPTLAAAGEFEYDDEQAVSPPAGRSVYVVRRKEPVGGTQFGGGVPGDAEGSGGGGVFGGGGDGGGVNASGSGGSGYGGGGTGGSGSGAAGVGAIGGGSVAGGGAGEVGYPGGPASSGSSVPTNGTRQGGSMAVAAGSSGGSFGSQGESSIGAVGGGPLDNHRSDAPPRTDFADTRPAQPGMYQDPGPATHSAGADHEDQVANRSDAKGQADSVASRGKDWALRHKPGRAVPVRRTIRVVVQNDQLAILADDALAQASSSGGRIVPLKGDTVESLDAFVTEVRELIDGWGIAGENLYWRPVLVLDVAPGGQDRASDLSRLLKNSGLELTSGGVASKSSRGGTQ